jgi:hypothetical protein
VSWVELPDGLVGGVRVPHPGAVPDHGASERAAGVGAEQLLELGLDVAGVAGAFVGLSADDPEVAQGRVVVLADLLDGLDQTARPATERKSSWVGTSTLAAATKAFMVSAVIPGGQSTSTRS